MTFRDVAGISHSVEVDADSLYEATARAIAAFRKSSMTEEIGAGTRFRIEVTPPTTAHELSLLQLTRWLESGTSPAEVMLRKRVQRLMDP